MRLRTPRLSIAMTSPGRKTSRRYRPECLLLEVRALLSSFTVSNLADSGRGSLRDAVAGANANPGADVVQFRKGVSGTIALGSPLFLTSDLTIQGPGASAVTLDGQGNTQLVSVGAGTSVSVSGLTIARGFGLLGGGIYNAGNLTLTNVAFTNDRSGGPFGQGPGNGGAIFNDTGGTVTISSSTFTGNQAYGTAGGGAIYNLGTLTLTGSSFSGNRAFYDSIAGAPLGDALRSTGSATIDLCTFRDTVNSIESTGSGSLTIRRSTIAGSSAAGLLSSNSLVLDSCTISGNGASSDWGAVTVRGTATITNCTIANNPSPGISAIRFTPIKPTTIVITSSTIAGNSVQATATDATTGAGINVLGVGAGPQISLHDTILAGNVLLRQGAAPLPHDLNTNTATSLGFKPTQYVSLGYNLIQAPGTAVFGGTTVGNIYGVDPLLGPLADNGGPTQTMALLAGSPALDAGDPAATDLPLFDQRGKPRVAHGRVDIGAYEVQ
jgi:hypothetical protein